jgi:hypothetical protein
MTPRLSRHYGKSLRRRGAGVIVFAAIMIPTALFALALTTDYGRVVLAVRQAADVADSVALAAASARSDEGDTLDAAEGTRRALATYQMAKSERMFSPAVRTKLNPGDIVFSPDGRSVRVKISWQVPVLPLVKLFSPGFDGIDGIATRSARICIAETDSRPCAYPV